MLLALPSNPSLLLEPELLHQASRAVGLGGSPVGRVRNPTVEPAPGERYSRVRYGNSSGRAISQALAGVANRIFSVSVAGEVVTGQRIHSPMPWLEKKKTRPGPIARAQTHFKRYMP